MKALFVTGTDTGVGKTIVSGLLARYLSEKDYKVATQKWTQTGGRDPGDIRLHFKIMGKLKKEQEDFSQLICPYTFRFAGSPHLASKIENRRINIGKIIKSFKLLSQNFDFVIVEGIGGLLVPLNKKRLVVDIVKKLDLPVLIVTGNKLGAINHTLLTIEALRQRKMKILGMVFNNLGPEDRRILDDNPKIIKALTKEKVFGVLPWEKSLDNLYDNFYPIGERIFRCLIKIGLKKT